jgi:hypothetical protein
MRKTDWQFSIKPLCKMDFSMKIDHNSSAWQKIRVKIFPKILQLGGKYSDVSKVVFVDV